MNDFLLIGHDGEVERVDSIKNVDMSYVRTLLVLDVECGSYDIVITELHSDGAQSIIKVSPN